jgi:hypothetical protein
MANTAKQQLIDRINRLHSDLREYKAAQTNPPIWMNTKALAIAIESIEIEISQLEAILEALPYNTYMHEIRSLD